MYVLENREKTTSEFYLENIRSLYSWTQNATKLHRKQDINAERKQVHVHQGLDPVCVFQVDRLENKDDRPTSDWPRHFCAPEPKAHAPVVGIYIHPSDINVSHLWVFWNCMYSKSSNSFVYFEPIIISMCFNMKLLKILYQVCVFRANHYRHVVQSKVRYSGTGLWLFEPLFIVMAPRIIPYGCWLVDCCLTSHSAIF